MDGCDYCSLTNYTVMRYSFLPQLEWLWLLFPDKLYCYDSMRNRYNHNSFLPWLERLWLFSPDKLYCYEEQVQLQQLLTLVNHDGCDSCRLLMNYDHKECTLVPWQTTATKKVYTCNSFLPQLGWLWLSSLTNYVCKCLTNNSTYIRLLLFLTDHVAYASTNKTKIVWIETEFFFYPGWMRLMFTCMLGR